MKAKILQFLKVIVFPCCIMFVSCVAARSTPLFSGTVTLRDKGRVCFQKSPQDSAIIKASVSGAGCFSSSCTEILERTGEIKIDTGKSVIQFNSRFVVRDISESVGLCTLDCGGAGSIWFDIEPLPDMVGKPIF